MSPKPASLSRSIRHPGAARLVLAVGLPLVLLLALEVGLRFAGFGKDSSFLITDEKPGYLRTNPDFASLFLPGNFDLRPLNFRIAAHKAPGTVRIVVLGESAAQGVPVPSFAFAPQLRAQLRAKYPGREFEVIDTGIVAINSHVIYQVAREMARYEPDIFLVYMGNNEVVGPYGPGCTYLSQMPPLWVIRASVFVRSTRIGQLFGWMAARLASHARRPAEWGGMSMFVDNAVAGDDPRLEGVYANFEANLKGIIAAASEAGAKIIVCTPVANLKDCAPFLSLHGPGLDGGRLETWKAAYEAGRLAWILGDTAKARPALEKALECDPHYAETSYLLGTLDLQAGSIDSARRRFVDALHWDALRFRPDPRIVRVIREVMRDAPGKAILLDGAMALGSDEASQAPISGHELLFEHVHFDWNGNYQLARLMAQSCGGALNGGDPGPSGWLDSEGCSRALAYSDHERLPMLLRIDVLVRKPPFTNQLTHVTDEARMARDIDAATARMSDPQVLSAALASAEAAVRADPNNPTLAGILEGIFLDQGQFGDAIGMARKAKGLLPRDFALSADEATILMRLGRFDEARAVLMGAAASGADLDLLAPVLSDYWARTKNFQEGTSYLGAEIARRPGDARLRIALGMLLGASGDSDGAMRELKAVLAMQPSNEEALEALVALLDKAARSEDAASLSVATVQPRNQANSLRAVKAFEARGDEDGAIRSLMEAERSGPVTATFELTLALKLYKLRRNAEMMEHLGEARRLSEIEGNPGVTASIVSLVDRMGRETDLQPPQKRE